MFCGNKVAQKVHFDHIRSGHDFDILTSKFNEFVSVLQVHLNCKFGEIPHPQRVMKYHKDTRTDGWTNNGNQNASGTVSTMAET